MTYCSTAGKGHQQQTLYMETVTSSPAQSKMSPIVPILTEPTWLASLYSDGDQNTTSNRRDSPGGEHLPEYDPADYTEAYILQRASQSMSGHYLPPGRVPSNDYTSLRCCPAFSASCGKEPMTLDRGEESPRAPAHTVVSQISDIDKSSEE